MRSILVVCLLCAFALPLSAADPKKNPPEVAGAPIPAKIISAKTVYLVVATRKQETNYKNAYKFLAAWDRWKIVDDPKVADLILRITDGTDGSVGFGSGSATTVGGYTSGTGTMLGVPLRHFYLAVLNPDGALLWGTDTDQRLASSANTGRMLKQLRERITQAERETTAASR